MGFAGLLVLTAIVLIGLAAGAWFGLRRSVPPLDGQLRLAGLTAPVEILFDAYGVPHVYARDVDDAWFAVGFLHGRERLWQMELYRRASGGRLSEVLGPATLRVDKRFVGLGLRRAADEEWQTATPLVRSALERYCRGVNAAVADDGPLAASAGVSGPGHRAGAVDAGRLAVGRAPDVVAPGREPLGRTGARTADRRDRRRRGEPADGRVALRRAVDRRAVPPFRRPSRPPTSGGQRTRRVQARRPDGVE